MDNIKICSWNANGVRNKINEMKEFLDRLDIDILMINETKLTKDIKLKIRNYNCIRKDRDNAAGGVAMLIKNSIPFKEVLISNISIECLCIKLASNIHLVSVYNKPRNFYEKKELNKLVKLGKKVIIYGDLNARHKSWNCHIDNKNGNTLLEFLQNSETTLMIPNEPTLYPNNGSTPTLIDIGINKNVANVSDSVVQHELSSDHLPVTFDLGMQHKITCENKYLDYSNANWKQFHDLLNKNLKIESKILTTKDIEAQVQKLTSIIQNSITQSISKKASNKTQDNLPLNILEAIKERNRNRKIWQKTRKKEDKELFSAQTKMIRSEIFKYRNRMWEKQLRKLNPRDNSLWKMTKIFKNDYQPIPTLIKDNNEAFLPESKANLLADQYEKVHNIDLTNNTTDQSKIIEAVENYMQSTIVKDYATFHTTPNEIKNIIKKLPAQKAPGLDGVQNIVLKNLTNKAVVQLMYIVNAMLKFSYFLSQWKTGSVIPILKPGKINTDPNSYRPISLLTTLSKLVEKIILKRFVDYENKNNILIDEQFGFRTKHSTTQQVTRITNDISINFNLNKVTVMLLLDIEKAFDRVWIDGLLFKLIKYNFPSTLIKLINSYLKNRHLKVNVNGCFSTKRKVNAGVPQGSVLGPKLFNIYLNDIPKFAKTKIALFADDTAIYKSSFNAIVAAKQIQIHVYLLEKFYAKWKIKLNEAKTEVIIFHKKYKDIKIFQPITVNSFKTVPTTIVKYLGITLDNNLTYQIHVKQVLRKAYSVQSKIYPLLAKSTMHISNKKLLYKMLIRPIITYAAPVWCNISKTNMLLLQRFQNKQLRLILSADRYIRINDLHSRTEIEFIDKYVKSLAENFYKTQINSSILTKNITKLRRYNLTFKLKHKLPHQFLPIFNQKDN